MKKMINTAGIYGILALASGVVARELTKAYNFNGLGTLGLSHVHLMAMGTMLFLILALFAKNTDLMKNSKFKKFNLVYNIGLPFAVIMMYVRGITQLKGVILSSGMEHMISGMAGLAHILMTVGLVFLFFALKEISQEQ